MSRFDKDAFIEQCRAASGAQAVREIVARAVSDPAAVIHELGAADVGGARKLYESADLTILDIAWAPKMTLQPHDHRMWAVIGVYSGREDNIFWKRSGANGDARIEAAGAKSLCARDAVILGPEIIHSVTNPTARITSALHIYGGDFMNAARSAWDPETLREEPFDISVLQRQLEDDNRRWFSTR